MGTFFFAIRFIASDTTNLVGDTSEIRLDQLEEVAVEGCLIPLLAADLFDDFAVGKRLGRAR